MRPDMGIQIMGMNRENSANKYHHGSRTVKMLESVAFFTMTILIGGAICDKSKCLRHSGNQRKSFVEMRTSSGFLHSIKLPPISALYFFEPIRIEFNKQKRYYIRNCKIND